MKTNQMIDQIYQRHCNALQLVGLDHGPARMSLWLALHELADRLIEQPKPVPEPDWVASVPATASESPSEDPPAMPQQLQPSTAAVGPRRSGRKPGTKNKPKDTPKLTLDEIAKQIEGDTPGQMATIDRNLIKDDPNVVALNGKLRSEESFATTHHGMPVRVTRQYIEIR